MCGYGVKKYFWVAASDKSPPSLPPTTTPAPLPPQQQRLEILQRDVRSFFHSNSRADSSTSAAKGAAAGNRPSQAAASKSGTGWAQEAVKRKALVLEDQAAMLVHAEQIRAAHQLIDEQVGQLMRQTR